MRSLRCVLATNCRSGTCPIPRAMARKDKNMSELIVVSRGGGREAGDAVLGGQETGRGMSGGSFGRSGGCISPAVSVWMPGRSSGQQPEHEALVGAAHLVGDGARQSHVLQATEDVQGVENMMKGISKARHDLTSAGNKTSGKNAFVRNAFLPQSATPRTGEILTGDCCGTQVKQ